MHSAWIRKLLLLVVVQQQKTRAANIIIYSRSKTKPVLLLVPELKNFFWIECELLNCRCTTTTLLVHFGILNRIKYYKLILLLCLFLKALYSLSPPEDNSTLGGIKWVLGGGRMGGEKWMNSVFFYFKILVLECGERWEWGLSIYTGDSLLKVFLTNWRVVRRATRNIGFGIRVDGGIREMTLLLRDTH